MQAGYWGAFATRMLWTDGDEVLFDAMRPIIINGIEDYVTRPDLADRTILLTLEEIPEDQRRAESELWAAFERKRARILGALLAAIAQGLKMLPQTKLATIASDGRLRSVDIRMRGRFVSRTLYGGLR